MTFVIVAIYYLINNNTRKYIVYVVIAMLFHSAAVCALLGLILTVIYKKLKKSRFSAGSACRRLGYMVQLF